MQILLKTGFSIVLQKSAAQENRQVIHHLWCGRTAPLEIFHVPDLIQGEGTFEQKGNDLADRMANDGRVQAMEEAPSLLYQG